MLERRIGVVIVRKGFRILWMEMWEPRTVVVFNCGCTVFAINSGQRIQTVTLPRE